MIKEANLCVGVFVKTRGINGELILKSDIELNEDIENAELIFIELDGLLVPFFIAQNGIKFQSDDMLYILLDNINDSDDAKKLIGKKVFFRKDDITTSKSINSDFITGFSVFNQDGDTIGIVSSVMKIPGNPLLSVIDQNNAEQLLPFQEDLILDYSLDKKTIILNLPEGLVDLQS